jgi:nicotinate-nucleotide pyrophosphorylase (carboxylating)
MRQRFVKRSTIWACPLQEYTQTTWLFAWLVEIEANSNWFRRSRNIVFPASLETRKVGSKMRIGEPRGNVGPLVACAVVAIVLCQYDSGESTEMNTAREITQKWSIDISTHVRHALEEDIGSGDVTTDPIVSPGSETAGQIVAKQSGIVAGLDVAATVFHLLDENIRFTANAGEGSRVESGTVLAEVAGSARAIFTAERTALNFIGRMSGIATLTKRFVETIAGTRAKILDTRKTAPGLRAIDKLAVQRGGGYNHRYGLYDMILIKDNHIDYAGGLAQAFRLVGDTPLEIEVEVRTLEDVKVAIELGVKRILLDNMTPEMMKEAVEITAGRAKLEASGNVTLETVRRIAETGVDYISVGELTHSAKVFDVSLKLKGG